MKKIGFLGLTFVSDNKGCMALAYSFKEIVERYAGIVEKIYIFSFDKYDLNKIDSFIKLELVYVSIKKPITIYNALKKMKECEIVFDFTEGDSFSDIYGLKRFLKISILKELAIKSATKYILCPQTYGPYICMISRKIATHIMKHAHYICSRDQLSSEAVKQLIDKDIDVYTDIAFGLKKKDIDLESEGKQIKIGINISALLWNGGYNNKNQFKLKVDYRTYIKKLIETLISLDKYTIHLVPHVYNSSSLGIENDYAVCQLIQQEYPECILAPCFDLPSEIKGYIAEMDYFVGARMHATIGAFSSGVVTVPVSYSRKFEGLYGSVNYQYLVNARQEDTQDAVDKTISYIYNGSKLSKAQSLSMSIVADKLRLFDYKIRQILYGD